MYVPVRSNSEETIPQTKIFDFCQLPLHKGALGYWHVFLTLPQRSLKRQNVRGENLQNAHILLCKLCYVYLFM